MLRPTVCLCRTFDKHRVTFSWPMLWFWEEQKSNEGLTQWFCVTDWRIISFLLIYEETALSCFYANFVEIGEMKYLYYLIAHFHAFCACMQRIILHCIFLGSHQSMSFHMESPWANAICFHNQLKTTFRLYCLTFIILKIKFQNWISLKAKHFHLLEMLYYFFFLFCDRHESNLALFYLIIFSMLIFNVSLYLTLHRVW